MLCTSGWFSLKSTRSFAVKSANIPRKMIRKTAGNIPISSFYAIETLEIWTLLYSAPTVAKALGSESIPLLTISAIINNDTNCSTTIFIYSVVCYIENYSLAMTVFCSESDRKNRQTHAPGTKPERPLKL